MKAAIINDERIVVNTIVVDELNDYPGAVDCPEWVSIGMSIDAPEPIIVPSAEMNKQQAVTQLQKTDWVNEPDVYDPVNTPHLLNRQEFLTYRAWVRNIAVNPVEGNLDWPTEPTAVWSS